MVKVIVVHGNKIDNIFKTYVVKDEIFITVHKAC